MFIKKPFPKKYAIFPKKYAVFPKKYAIQLKQKQGAKPVSCVAALVVVA